MRFDPYSEKDQSRLSKAVQTSYENMGWLRNLTRELVKEYAGSGYGKNRPSRETIVNLMHQTVEAYTMRLVANRPRVMTSTARQDLLFFAKKYEIATNKLIEEIGLEFTLRRWTLDAYFGLGVVKVHLADSGLVQLEQDRWADPGRPFASNVGLENYVVDMSATKKESRFFEGDCYRIPFSDLESDIYDQDIVKDLAPTTRQSFEEERLDQIARGETVDDDELEPMIDLCDMWFPRDGMIYTFPVNRKGKFEVKGRPVAAMEWYGTERGPYYELSFGDVPENTLPTSLAAQNWPLHRIINAALRKESRQLQRQKEVHFCRPGSEKDAEKIREANDGQIIPVNDPSEHSSMRFGGIDGPNHAKIMSDMQLYDRMAGNLTAMLGLGSQAPTASQEEMIQGQISNKEAQMKYRVQDATVRLVRELAYLLWHDKAKIIPARMPIDGTDIDVDATWTPDDREGSPFDYDVSIDIHSMPYQSPEQKWGKLNAFLANTYAPLAPHFQASGAQLDLQAITDLAAGLLNTPEIKQIVTFAAPLPVPEAEAAPVNNTTTHERRSVAAGPTPQNAMAMQAQEFMAMGRPQETGGMRGNPA